MQRDGEKGAGKATVGGPAGNEGSGSDDGDGAAGVCFRFRNMRR